MLAVDRIDDPEKLRKVASLLDREVGRLQEQVRDLTFENARLRGETLAQVDFAFPKLALQKALEQAVEPTASRPPRPTQPGHGPQPQQRLAVVERKLELPADARACTSCGGTLEEMKGQSEDAEEITVTERSYTLVLNHRQKYRCSCNGSVVTAPGPDKLIPGGRYSLDFAAHVATQKFGDHLPLERQVEIMGRLGLEVTSQTLWDQTEAAASVLTPTYETIGAWLLTQPLLHVDETGWPVDAKDSGKPRWTAWCLCNEKAAWFHIASAKSEAEGRRLIGSYRGAVVADGYRVYKNLAAGAGREGYLLAHCWAHVLRKFRDTLENDPRSGWILERIGALYREEGEIELATRGEPERHLALRKERLAPALEGIRSWAISQGGLRRSDFGRALAYLLSHWQGLTRVLEDARVPLDNNPAERALRGLVVGRKNHHGSRSQRGAKVSAIFYTLVGSARLAGVDPGAYLRTAITAAVRKPGTVTFPF